MKSILVVGLCCVGRIVGHQHKRGARLAAELEQEFNDGIACTLIEVARGLVCENETRLVHQGPRHGDALALAARKLGGKMVAALAEAHLDKQ